MTPERIAEIKQRYNDARKHIGELASTALKAWRMSIPANRERDSDLRIADSLDDIPALLLAVETLQADNSALRDTINKNEECMEILRTEVERIDEAIAECNTGPPAYRIKLRNQRNELEALNKAYARVTADNARLRAALVMARETLDDCTDIVTTRFIPMAITDIDAALEDAK
jgi:chromosome segregation ATPase